MNVTAPSSSPRSASVVIIAAVSAELRLLRHTLGATVAEDGVFAVYQGKIAATEVVLVVGGLGKINAAAATAFAIERYRPRLIINCGCAGAFVGAGIAVGDVAVATEEIAADEGVLTAGGWEPLDSIGIPVVETAAGACFNSIPLNKQVADDFVAIVRLNGFSVARGAFATVSTCSGTLARGNELRERFGVICESMEGAAVAQVALRYGVDCLEVRGVSNLVEDRDLSRWDIPRAVEAAQRLVLAYLQSSGALE